MLDEMAQAAPDVFAKNKSGFIAMIEGASIDKQAHLMDTDRWLLEIVEFDRTVEVEKDCADKHPDTIVIVTGDQECAGAAIIGASTKPASALWDAMAKPGAAEQRDKIVGVYQAAKFPKYKILDDGFPLPTDVDYKMLIGYGANADRYETGLSNVTPTRDTPQPFATQGAQAGHSVDPSVRNKDTGFLVTGQVPGDLAVHTATDVPLPAYGRGAAAFTSVMDNTEVFFRLARAVRPR
jgi:alkaline phosphatase